MKGERVAIDGWQRRKRVTAREVRRALARFEADRGRRPHQCHRDGCRVEDRFDAASNTRIRIWVCLECGEIVHSKTWDLPVLEVRFRQAGVTA